MPKDLELLAPAGDWAALEAALDAGADAVYLGLRTLNARRRAKNFSPDEFVKAVETVHARGAKAYLTLNIDLAQREIGQAARMLELARQCSCRCRLGPRSGLAGLAPGISGNRISHVHANLHGQQRRRGRCGRVGGTTAWSWPAK